MTVATHSRRRPLLGLVGGVALSAVKRAAAGYDAFPLAPHRLADAALDAHFDRVHRNAQHDPTWAAIQQRRLNEDGTITMLSDDLTLDDWVRQDEIAAELTPEPRWVRLARATAGVTARRALAKVAWAAQMLSRGWADADTYSLDWTLCTRLAAQLDHLAAHTHGYPSTEQYPTFELWQADLRKAAAGLRGWATREDTATNRALLDATGEAFVALLEVQNQEEERRLADAREAFAWIGENLPDLWD